MKIKIKNLIYKDTDKGFSIIEVMIGIAVFIVIIGAFTLFARNIWTFESYLSVGLAGSNEARVALKTMTAEIRTASTADTGVYVVALATASAFTIYSDIDSDGLKERVRYFLNGTSLQKGVIKPTGSPLAYNTANEVISTLAWGVRNSTIFDYYDEDYDGTTAALSSPVNASSIRLIKITLNIDKVLNKAPAERVFSTQVSMRNLKDNL